MANLAVNAQDHDRIPMSITNASGSGDESAPDDISAGQKMLSAISGSLLTSLLVTPLDVVRVRLQSQATPSTQLAEFHKLSVSTPNAFRPSNIGVTACCREVFFINNNAEACVADSIAGITAGDCAVEQVQKRTFTSTFDGMRKIAQNEGISTLWRGLSPTLVMAIPANIIYFTGYDWLRYNPASPIAKVTNGDMTPLVAGGFARMLAASAVSPIELFRTRLQASTGSSTTGHLANTVQGVREMVAEHGYRSLWRGLTLTLWRDVPFSAMYWWGYEAIRGKLTDIREESRGRAVHRDSHSKQHSRSRSQSRENHTATFTDSFVAGALSGAFASIVTTPFDVGKTRTQTFHDAAKKSTGATEQAVAPEARSMVRLLWHIYLTEGIPGLWKGWIPRTLKVAPACAIMISSYEVGKRVFRTMNERQQAMSLESFSEKNS
ncbi:mitochondrial carrier domain-containing protein [Microdochium trichocladiopsis]|uniref:Mitochondrial carrier domain-containing protein n=1 Tax=Microdochium trichocladiopsis TaxID=1682393 RepID=A0A9P9BN72_9PEZI|nr:mitochondrial carrier domain-containing protein [Microdochium trichocladiopsis]KAH7027428.1 mitochondrial carrier domain-containing protein [Microdochium trichocladiopsis]